MKKRPNPLHPAARKRRGQPRIKVYQIHCKACQCRYALAYAGKVTYCLNCQSDQIEVASRSRNETPAERAQRNRRTTAHLIDFGIRFISGMFGFQVPPHFNPGPPPYLGRDKANGLETELLKEGYRKLATKYHPDKGGDPEKMKELNRLKERLGL